mgnify:CR=1 FL=1
MNYRDNSDVVRIEKNLNQTKRSRHLDGIFVMPAPSAEVEDV